MVGQIARCIFPYNPDDQTIDLPPATRLALSLIEAQVAKFAAGGTKYDGLASWILNTALYKRYPGCNPKEVCDPLVKRGLAHYRGVKNGVIYKLGPGSREADTLADELLDEVEGKS